MIERRSGVLVPLFSFPSTASWGIGEIPDIDPMSAWLGEAGQRVLQVLPLNEMAPGQSSPYSALSAMAIDPIYIHVPGVAELGPLALDGIDRGKLEEAQHAVQVDYRTVRHLKRGALVESFTRFYDNEWRRDTDRARAFRAFRGSQAWWIDDYALFRAIHAREDERSWFEWPEPLRTREPEALATARHELARDMLFFQYLQWLADLQWQAARAAAGSHGVALFGDLPFMVDGDSADVWARQHQFNLDVSIGVPPDAFSATGQDWGLPACRWDVMAADDFGWLRERARRSTDLYEGYRIDHLVGFYRTYARPRNGGEPFFSPVAREDQIALGERILRVFAQPGAAIIAEDLGTVPDYVRQSLARMSLPGFRVLRWERHWEREGQPFREPSEYPAVSVATSGTHDTETLAVWWERASADERRLVSDLAVVQRLTGGEGLQHAPFLPTVRDTLLEILAGSGSALLLIVIHDVFGWRDRINEPSTVGDQNWTFRLPWPSDRLGEVAEARERQSMLRALMRKYSRT
jgi:4-alpha-glucanotransferase